jgi:hypothetical protein
MAVALGCFSQTRRIQAFAIASMSKGRCLPLKEWVSGNQYEFSIKMCGGIALLMAIILAWAAIDDFWAMR